MENHSAVSGPLKYCFNPKSGKFLEAGGGCHASVLEGKAFDSWVRIITWPELKRIYFRFHIVNGNYYDKPSEDDIQASYDACDKALDYMIRAKVVKKSWKVLFWHSDKVVTDQIIKNS